ncbi:MAG: hypothetical protein R3B82_02205 [Sandaracinaceae bacterium]
MHWFDIYAKEIWVLPSNHLLARGSWDNLPLLGGCFAVATTGACPRLADQRRASRILSSSSALAFLAPFFQAGWGGLLFIAGVVGGNVAGWSRRLAAALPRGLYAFLVVLTIAMCFSLRSDQPGDGDPRRERSQVGDRIVAIAGVDHIEGWAGVRDAVLRWEPTCTDSRWNPESTCRRTRPCVRERPPVDAERGIPATLERGGERIEVTLPDPAATQRAGDRRILAAQPELPLSPWVLGIILFLISLCVIGTHGLLSGTATMDFGGRKGAGTAVGVIDGFVYLGTGLQSFSLGYLTTQDWAYWPWFLVPFAIIGFLLTTRIWNAKPKGQGGH